MHALALQLKRAQQEEERSKEQRRASLAATRRPGLANSASGEAATPSGAPQGAPPTDMSAVCG